jgi:hypothetical protein
MTAKQLAPNCEQAIAALRTLLLEFTPGAFDLTPETDDKGILARWQVGEASLQRLEIELGFRRPPSPNAKKKQTGRAE